MPKPAALRGWGVDDHQVKAAEEKEKIYVKLVRDNIPELMREEGKRPKTRIAGQAEYRRRLMQKLMEEAIEYTSAPDLEELADVLEVVHSLCSLHKITFAKLETVRKTKSKKKGPSRRGYYLKAHE